MQGCIRSSLVRNSLVLLLVSTATPARAQIPVDIKPFVPLSAPTQQDRDRREAVHCFVLGVLCEREDRLLEAVRAYEKSAELDPAESAVHRSLIPVYLALERAGDALRATRRTLELDPADAEIWYMYARQLKDAGKYADAREALRRGIAVPEVKDMPDLAEQMYANLGQLCETSEEYVDAAAAYAEAAKILDQPDALLQRGIGTPELIAQRAAEMHERVGRMYLQAKRHDKAVAAYQQAQKRYPEGAGRLNFNLAQVSQTQGKWAEAVAYLDGYLRFQPQGAEAYELKIALLHKLGRGAEVLPWLEKASQSDPFNAGLKLLLANQAAHAGQSAKAEKLYQQLAADGPSPEVYRGLFRVYCDENAKGLTKALALLDTTLAEARKKDFPSPLAATQARAMFAALREDAQSTGHLVDLAMRQDQGPRLRFETLQLLAVLADQHRMLPEAEHLFRRCLSDLAPNHETAVYGGLLRVLWKERKYEDILQVCRDGLERTRAANHVLLHNDMARALAQLGRLEEALAAADRAIEQAADGDRLVVRLLRLRILTLAEQYDRAEADGLAMLKNNPSPGEALEIRYLLSGVYSAAKNMAKSEEQLELILKADPDNATANNDLGYLWADQGRNLARAEEMIRRAIDIDRQNRKAAKNLPPGADHDNTAYVDSLGWVLFRKGEIEAARVELERAAALPDSDDPVIWDHLGDVYQRLQLFDRARAPGSAQSTFMNSPSAVKWTSDIKTCSRSS